MYDSPAGALVILADMQVDKFSRYELREELGQGGMAAVYRAHDPLFEREVALKILKQELLNNPQLRERFERETKIIAKLEHAAIVPVYDAGHDKDQLFFVMRYMGAGSLADRIQNHSMSLTEIAQIVRRLASALDYAHEKGVVHRDLKPGNILFDEYENAYISDFGIAKFANSTIKLTNSGIIGTPTYMSPEQAQGEEVDGRSDTYSLGVMLFEMLSGRPPYEASTPLGMAFKHATEPVPSILEINPALPIGIERIMQRVLAKEPEQRYASALEFADAFSRALSEATPPNVSTSSEERTAYSFSASFRAWMVGGMLLLMIVTLWGYPLQPQSPALPAQTSQTQAASPDPAEALTQPMIVPATAIVLTPSYAADTLPEPVGGADQIALTINKDVYLLDITGEAYTQLTNSNQYKFDLQWLPSGDILLYGEGQCIYTVTVQDLQTSPEKSFCFDGANLSGFRVSPDGLQAALSIDQHLLIVPFDEKLLSLHPSLESLQSLSSLCLDYAEISVKRALWSADGKKLAVLHESVIGDGRRESLRVLAIDPQRCQAVDALVLDEFPGDKIKLEGYERSPVLPVFDWDGDKRFLVNTFQRNISYGDLYLYDMTDGQAHKLNPIQDVCCYGNAIFSPDGTYILFVFQDVRQGAKSTTQLYYLPFAELNEPTTAAPFKLPVGFFRDSREPIQLALRPANR